MKQEVQAIDVAIVSRDASISLRITHYEGTYAVLNRHAWASYFTFRRPQSTVEGRVGVLVADGFELVNPVAFGLSDKLDRNEFSLECAYARIGEHLDEHGLLPSTPAGANATELVCDSRQLRNWAEGEAAADDTILRYIRGKLYWSWKFEFAGAAFSASDCLRLHARIKTLRRVAEIGMEHLWTFSGTTENGFMLRPLPAFIREQHETRNTTPYGGGSTSALLAAPRYAGPAAHWRKAEDYSRGEIRDLPNAAKEAICAVEGVARIITGDHSATLGDSIKQLKASKQLAPSLAKSLEGIWGFTSNSPGVRHGGAAPSTITQSEARWVLDSSEAAIRLLLPLDG